MVVYSAGHTHDFLHTLQKSFFCGIIQFSCKEELFCREPGNTGEKDGRRSPLLDLGYSFCRFDPPIESRPIHHTRDDKHFAWRGERHGRMVWWCLWLVCVYASSPRRCNSVTVSFCIGLNSICPWGWKWWIWASMVCASIDLHCVDIYMIIHVIVYVYNIRYCIRQISSHVMWNVMMQRLENTNDHGTSHSSHLTTLLEALLIMLCFPEPIRPSPSQELNLACKFTVDQIACVCSGQSYESWLMSRWYWSSIDPLLL